MESPKTDIRGVRRSPIKRKSKFTVRFDDVEEEVVKVRAKALHIPMATYMRMAILNYRRKD